MTTTEPTPVFDELIADLGPLQEVVVTDFDVLVSRAVLALAGGQPA